MNIHLDDPKLTAYALDELSGAEKMEMATAVAASPAAQQYVAELREFSGLLHSEYDAERATLPALRTNILPLPQKDDPWTFSRRLALAATIALAALIGVVAIGTMKRGGLPGQGKRGLVANGSTTSHSAETPVFAEDEPVIATGTPIPMAEEVGPNPVLGINRDLIDGSGGRSANGLALAKSSSAAPNAMMSYQTAPAPPPLAGRYRHDFDTAEYGHIEENPFLAAKGNPLSTFSIDVDTASYANVRRFIEDGALPPKDAVRIEEIINYFTYDYPQPTDDTPFSINLDAASCPWAPTHRLVRIGLKGREMPNEKRPSSNLVFLLDVSGSMDGPNRLPLVKQAMRLLVDKLGENDRVAIVVYAGGSGLALPSTNGTQKEKILSAIEDLKAGGSTNGAEGIELAYQTAAAHFIKGGTNRVILATDGDFNIGVTNNGDLVRLIEEKAKSGVFLSVLGVGDNNLNDSMMQQLADKGNGNYAYLDSIAEARKVLVQQMSGTLVTIAKDVKIQVEFNPARVASYRLIGYEKRLLRKEDFNDDKVDAGEIGAGHTVTALYEVVPVGAANDPASNVPAVDALKYQANGAKPAPSIAPQGSGELLTVKLRYKKPDGDKSELRERSFVDSGAKFENATVDLKFAAAVAEFGMLLHDSANKGNGTLGAVAEWAQEGKGADAEGYRAGFIELVRKARALKKS